jgi:8-oxo-dGTP diphosphatase
MLKFITGLPTEKRIAGVHCIPVLKNGNMMMVWDQDEQGLTTIGGRLEKGESIESALEREAMEEAGIKLSNDKSVFASWYWKETDTYSIWYLTGVAEFVGMPEGFEKSGYIITNFQTAINMIEKIEGTGSRIEIVRMAGVLSGQLKTEGGAIKHSI